MNEYLPLFQGMDLKNEEAKRLYLWVRGNGEYGIADAIA